MTAKHIIERARDKYPLSVFYRAENKDLSEEDYKELEESCDIKCEYAYKDGSKELCITYKGDLA